MKIILKLLLNYAGVIPKFEIFKAYMTHVTGDYTALYIDNSAQDNGEWYEHVYYWKVLKWTQEI